MSTDTANIAGFQLVKQLPTHDSNIEYWIADDAGRSSEVYFVPENQRKRLSSLPNLLGFTQCRIVDLETRLAVVMPGIIATPIRTLKTKLSSTDCIGIAWHIADLLSLLHQSGRAHNLLHPDSIGLNDQGALEIRPALGRFIASDPDPKASAIATDCWQMRQVMSQLGITKKVEPLFALLNRGLQEEFARLRLQPATAIRQSISAVLARHADWENSFVEKMGTSWALNQRNIQESTVIPHRLQEMRPTMSIQDLRDMPDSIDLWGNLFTSSSVDETSSAQALLLEALANRQQAMPQSLSSKIVLPAQSELQVNEPIEKLEIDLQGPSSIQISVQQPVRKHSDLVSIQEVGLEDDVSPAEPDDEGDYFQGLSAIVEETAEDLEVLHQRRRRLLSRKEATVSPPMKSMIPLIKEAVDETHTIRGIVEEYEDNHQPLTSNTLNEVGAVISVEPKNIVVPTSLSALKDTHPKVEEYESEDVEGLQEIQRSQGQLKGSEEVCSVHLTNIDVDDRDRLTEDNVTDLTVAPGADNQVFDLQDTMVEVEGEGEGEGEQDEAPEIVHVDSEDSLEPEQSVMVPDNLLDVAVPKDDVPFVSLAEIEAEAVNPIELVEEPLVEEPLSIEEFSLEETVVVSILPVDSEPSVEKVSAQSLTEAQPVSSDKTDESIDKKDIETEDIETEDIEVQEALEESEQSTESEFIIDTLDFDQSVEHTNIMQITEDESGSAEVDDLTGRVSIYNMPLVSIVEEMSEEIHEGVSEDRNAASPYGVRLSKEHSGDVQSDSEEEFDESEGVNIQFLMGDDPSIPISVERLSAVLEPINEPSVSSFLNDTTEPPRNTNPSIAHNDGFVASLNPAVVLMSKGDLDVEEPLAEIEFPSIEEVHAQDSAFTGTIDALFDGETFGKNDLESSERSVTLAYPSASSSSIDAFTASRTSVDGTIEPKWTGSTAFDNLPNEEEALGDEKYALYQVELGDVDAVLGESIRDFSEVERRGSPWGLFLVVSLAVIFGIVYLLNPQQEDVSMTTTENTTMTGDASPMTALTTQVQIQTDPAQGRIYIDNVELGVAPLQWDITEGDVFLMCVDWKGTQSNSTCRRIPRGDLESDYTFARQLTP